MKSGNEPVTASYHIYSGTECETRSIMRALVPNPARPGRHQSRPRSSTPVDKIHKKNVLFFILFSILKLSAKRRADMGP